VPSLAFPFSSGRAWRCSPAADDHVRRVVAQPRQPPTTRCYCLPLAPQTDSLASGECGRQKLFRGRSLTGARPPTTDVNGPTRRLARWGRPLAALCHALAATLELVARLSSCFHGVDDHNLPHSLNWHSDIRLAFLLARKRTICPLLECGAFCCLVLVSGDTSWGLEGAMH